MTPRPLELLAPAKNAEFGIEAIKHGADAVYIGGPGFGARAAAGNAVADIARLADYAHRYRAQVFLALNTLLTDAELEPARQLAWQAWEAGVDALIVQDMGLLELDLPPIALHASTQTDNRDRAKVAFLAQAGFSRVVLARELSLEQIRTIAAGTPVELEFFVHGALCVSYSGQCYVSHAQTGRSANRGECSQMCRLPFSVADSDGRIIAQDKHVLSPKDNNQSENLRALAEAGIRSFKIEGRLKDLAYVKNITAHYRQRLDALIDEAPGYRAASSGRCRFFFQPQAQKSFQRGFTDYFLHGRRVDLLTEDSPKHVGEAVGTLARAGEGWIEIDGGETLVNGDGLSWYDAQRRLVGARINRVDGARLYLAERQAPPAPGARIHRNRDHAFERALEKDSAERRIALRMTLTETADGYALKLCDEDGVCAHAEQSHAHESAHNPQQADDALRAALGKLGGSPFYAERIDLALGAPRFLPASAVNALRRAAVAALEQARRASHLRPRRAQAAEPPPTYPHSALSYLGNVINRKARQFYARHGVALIDDGFELNTTQGEVSLMITKHCVRYSYNLCPKQVKGLRADPMTLISAGENLRLEFDCQRCEMHVLGKSRQR